ncbi:unnamed protein product [Prunus brigantina]
MLHDPKCRFDYPLTPIRLHHADLFSLDRPSRTSPINTKLKTTFKRSRHPGHGRDRHTWSRRHGRGLLPLASLGKEGVPICIFQSPLHGLLNRPNESGRDALLVPDPSILVIRITAQPRRQSKKGHPRLKLEGDASHAVLLGDVGRQRREPVG